MKSANALFGVILLLVAAVLTGCKSTDIVQLSPDTYMVTVEDHAGIFAGSPAKLKARTIRAANAFAESNGKITIPVAMQYHPVGGFRDWPSFEYQFMVLDKSDPQALRTSLVPRADFVVQKTEKISADVRAKDETDKKPDLYSELTKLDDLRKKGLITDQEFESEKQKLLNQAN